MAAGGVVMVAPSSSCEARARAPEGRRGKTSSSASIFSAREGGVAVSGGHRSARCGKVSRTRGRGRGYRRDRLSPNPQSARACVPSFLFSICFFVVVCNCGAARSRRIEGRLRQEVPQIVAINCHFSGPRRRCQRIAGQDMICDSLLKKSRKGRKETESDLPNMVGT